MGHAMLVVAFIAGTRLDPGTKGNRFDALKGFGGVGQAVRQSAFLNTLLGRTP
jgi:hypothetical protein